MLRSIHRVGNGPLPSCEWTTLLDQAPEPVFVHDGEQRILRCNAAYAAAAGRPMSDIVGKRYWEVLPRLSEGPPPCPVRCGAETRAPASFGIGDRMFEIRETTAHTADGRFWYCRHIFHDVTERERLQTALAEKTKALEKERSISNAVIDAAPNAFFLVDQYGRLVRWNGRLQQALKLGGEAMRCFSVLSVVHPDDRALAEAKLLAVLATGAGEVELRIGASLYLTTVRRVLLDDVPYVAGFCTDITARKRAEVALAKEKSFSDAIFDSMPGILWVVDSEGNYRRWNSDLNRLIGLSDHEIYGRNSLLAVSEEDRPHAARRLAEALEHGYAEAIVHVKTCQHGVRAYLTARRRFEFGGATYIAGIALDTTEQLATIAALQQEARTDALTRVANRSYFLERGNDEFLRCRRYGHSLSIWMLDLDHFKRVNDSHGHQAGDAVLRAFVSTCREVIRDWDTIGRMGGEEFAVLLPETDSTQATLVGERLRQAVRSTAVEVAPGASVSVTVSVGIASVREGDDDVYAVLARADDALYRAKGTGRDKVCVA
ncbi:MAG TPA: diguanylate cyclase [Rhodocyclaceae bacterium]